MTDEQTLNENVAMLDLAKAQMEGLVRQQELLRLSIEEHSRAKETVQRLSENAPGDDVLVPVGADSFIYAKVSDKREALVGVGADVAIQRRPEEVLKVFDAKIEELSGALHKVSEKASEIDGAIQELSQRIQEQYDQLRASGRA